MKTDFTLLEVRNLKTYFYTLDGTVPAVDGVDRHYTLSVGTGLQLNRVVFDIAYEWRWGNDVSADTLRGIGATEDVQRHRVLASLIYHF